MPNIQQVLDQGLIGVWEYPAVARQICHEMCTSVSLSIIPHEHISIATETIRSFRPPVCVGADFRIPSATLLWVQGVNASAGVSVCHLSACERNFLVLLDGLQQHIQCMRKLEWVDTPDSSGLTSTSGMIGMSSVSTVVPLANGVSLTQSRSCFSVLG